jgi:hypothetical protein
LELEPLIPKQVQLAVIIAMPSQNSGVGKHVSADDSADMDLAEKIGGTVEIGVARFDMGGLAVSTSHTASS